MEDKYQKYKNTAFSSEQWYVIRTAIDEDVEVYDIANPRFTVEQMKILIEARKAGIDLKGLIDPELSEEQMKRILDKIYQEMGLYEDHYEKVRRKWLKNMTWTVAFAAICILSGAVVLATKDSWMKYFEDLYLQFNCEVAVIEAGEPFEPASYIKAYDPEAKIDFPNQEEINTEKPGSYWAVYHISNGKKEKELKLLIEVKDTKKPEIELKTDNVETTDIESVKPESYLIKATDNTDGDMKEKVEIRKEGNSFIYSVTDSSGNTAEEKLKVTIKQKKEEPQHPLPSQGNSEQKTEQNQTVPPAEVPITASSRNFPFEDGKSFEQTYQECMNAGSAAVSAGQANQASCTVYDDENGIHKGYLLTFR